MKLSLVMIFILTLTVLVAILWPYLRHRHTQQRISTTPFPAAWRKILRQQLPIYRVLPTDLQLRLKKLVQLFLTEKQFIGCDGLEITDEIRINIAAQACLLVLNRPGQLYPSLHTILVYPSAYQVTQTQNDAAGVVSQVQQIRQGESWQQGRVILSWQDSQRGAALPHDGHNVVLHEFAHQLDQENGTANGAPFLSSTAAYHDWSQTLGAEFNLLQQQLQQGQATLFDPYAATHPAEFFAVITEVFFEQPQQFSARHPALYQQLCRFYRLDPRGWEFSIN